MEVRQDAGEHGGVLFDSNEYPLDSVQTVVGERQIVTLLVFLLIMLICNCVVVAGLHVFIGGLPSVY